MLRVPDGVLAVMGFGVGGGVGDAFAVTLEGAGFGTREGVEEAPFVDLVADLARDCEDIGHGDSGGRGGFVLYDFCMEGLEDWGRN